MTVNFLIAILFIVIIDIKLKPRLDWDGVKLRLWYNESNGRNHIVLW